MQRCLEVSRLRNLPAVPARGNPRRRNMSHSAVTNLSLHHVQCSRIAMRAHSMQRDLMRRSPMLRARRGMVQAQARFCVMRNIPRTRGMRGERRHLCRERQDGYSGSNSRRAHGLWVAVAGIRPEQVQD